MNGALQNRRIRDLSGKVAFVTGGTSGIGLGITDALLRAGMRVAMTYRNETRLSSAMARLSDVSAECHPIRLDVTDRKAVLEVAASVERDMGSVYLLCNNAGVNVLGPMEDATFGDWDWILAVNLAGVVNVLGAFLPRMNRSGGGAHIVNVASMAAFLPGPGAGVYTTSKSAVRGLSECLWHSLKPHGIGVSLLCPGPVDTRIYESVLRRSTRFGASGSTADESTIKRWRNLHAQGMDPFDVGARMLEAIGEGRFYIFTHSGFGAEVERAMNRILKELPD